MSALSAWEVNPFAQPPTYDVFSQQKSDLVPPLLQATNLCKDVADLVSEYAARGDAFGAEMWKKCTGWNVGPEPELGAEFSKRWNSSEFSKTHYPPVLIPERVTDPFGNSIPYSYEWLASIAKNPKIGSPLKMPQNLAILRKTDLVSDKPSHWLVLSKNLLACDKAWENQTEDLLDAGYEKEPSLLDLTTAVFAEHLTNQESFLGDAKNGSISARCRERADRLVTDPQLAICKIGKANFHIMISRAKDKTMGVPGMIKFPKP